MSECISIVDQKYWDDHYVNTELVVARDDDPITALIREVVRPTVGGTVFEVGCFPGRYLAQLGRLGYQLNGIDNTRRVRELGPWLRSNRLSVGDIFEGDFFSFPLMAKYDVVVSFGYIEHFEDLKSVIERHCLLVAPKGLLLISFPNFSGIVQRMLHTLLDRENLKAHNLNAMNLRRISKVCEARGYEIIFCGHFGNFDFWSESLVYWPMQRYALKVINRVKPYLKKLPECSAWSPYGAVVAKLKS